MNPLPIHPLKSTLLGLINESRSIKSFKQIHALLLTSSTIQDRLVVVEIIKAFATFNHLSHAYEILKQVPLHLQTPFLFNSLISGFANGSGTPKLAIWVYKYMSGNGFFPDKYTFPIILKSGAKFSGIGEAKQVHGVVVKMGFLCDVYLQNALVHVYGSCGQCVEASYLFDEMPLRDVVSWTSLISGYVKGGLFSQAVSLFLQMDVEPNKATLVSVLIACGRWGHADMGKRIHSLILKREPELDLVLGNSLLDMYVKCEHLDEARQVFDGLTSRDVISWTSIISGLAQCKRPKEALEVFHDMQASGVEPDKVTLASVLSACASLGALDSGRWVHEYIDRKGIELDVHLGTSMVDMYAKCGCIETALHAFHKMPHKNIFSWNALLGGLAIHGHGGDALKSYHSMIRTGLVPNEVTFIAILSACSHSGLVEEGRHYFNAMTNFYNLMPRIEHYGCMVDLLTRAGLLEEAHDLIRAMPMEPDVLICGAMLSACKAHGNIKLTQQILGYLVEFESCDSGVYVLLSNMCATNDRWEDVTRMRKLMKKKGIKKAPGSSVIEINGKTYEFLAGNTDNSQEEEILMVLDMLAKQIQFDEHPLDTLAQSPYSIGYTQQQFMDNLEHISLHVQMLQGRVDT